MFPLPITISSEFSYLTQLQQIGAADVSATCMCWHEGKGGGGEKACRTKSQVDVNTWQTQVRPIYLTKLQHSNVIAPLCASL